MVTLEDRYKQLIVQRIGKDADFEKWYQILSDIIDELMKGSISPKDKDWYKIVLLQDIVAGGYSWMGEILKLADDIYKGVTTITALRNPTGRLKNLLQDLQKEIERHYKFLKEKKR